MPDLYKLTIEKGPDDAVAQLAQGGTVVVKKGFAEDEKLSVGDPLTLLTPERQDRERARRRDRQGRGRARRRPDAADLHRGA